MKQLIRATLLRHAPALFYAISSVRFFQRCKVRYEDIQNHFHREVYGNGRIGVLSGPFKGMEYYNKIIWGPVTGKWIGCYEEELSGVIREILGSGYDTLIDVGAAEGYYAVGFAYKLPAAKVISYDIDPIARRRQRQLAKLNGVGNLEVLKSCNHEELASRITGRCFVMTDVEGFELELLDPEKCPALTGCDILVEIHRAAGMEVSGVENAISGRFSRTHKITRFGVAPRDPGSMRRIPGLETLSADLLLRAASEDRMPEQCWLWMKSRQHD
ncbi:MAG TPA: hypothetical protein VIM57_07965 [Luteolibacter sp.]